MSPQEGGPLPSRPSTSFLSPRTPSQGSRKQRGEQATWEEFTPRSVEQIPEGMKVSDYANPG